MHLIFQSIIVSFLVSSVVLGALHICTLTLSTLRKEVRELSHEAYLEEILREVADDIDSSSLPFSPKIHTRGLISYTDGSEVPISSRLKPDPESTALSSIRLYPKLSLWIHNIKRESNSFKGEGCFRFTKSGSLSDIRLYVGISVDGFTLLRGEASRLSPGCREISFSKAKSVVIQENVINPKTIRTLIPVIKEYSIYLDKNLTLRYISHGGGETLENQPLIDEIEAPLSFSLTNAYEGNLYLLRGELKETKVPFASAQRLIRDNYLSYLFGAP